MATTLKYRDYVANVEYDPELEQFFGSVANLSSPVTFYGSSVDELKREFSQSIETYLEVCAERGIEPEKPYSGRFNIRITPEQHRRFAQVAALREKSLNAWAVEALEKAGQAD